MTSIETLNEINEYMREYLRYHNMISTLEAFEHDIKNKQMPRRLRNDGTGGNREEPRIHLLFKPVSLAEREAFEERAQS